MNLFVQISCYSVIIIYFGCAVKWFGGMYYAILVSMKKGFTIVELLIVIVVIAILAAISIVAYNGIQSRANDTAVRSDLNNLARKYEIYKIDNGGYPTGNIQLDTLDISMTIGAYAEPNSGYNLVNCTNPDDSRQDYAMVATSKSGKRFYITNTSAGPQEYTGNGTWLPSANACSSASSVATKPDGAGYAEGLTPQWREWVQ